ncbi:MAG: formylglycine-generating enzyme family protein, partial [Myxococcota bacterium]
GREPDALALVPRDRPGRSGATGVPLYGRDARGRFVLARDADGDVWQPHWPVMFVSWPMACAYAAEIARRTRLPWRLPGEIEWEKAARGVDGRHFPFGDFCDPTWCCIGESHAGRPLPPDRDAYPDDVGPYGVRDLAGNALDWTADAFERRRPELDGGVARGVAGAADAARVVRGGSFGSSPGRARSAERTYALPDYRAAGLSFRLTRSWPA